MSSCMWPLMDFVGDEDVEVSREAALDEIKSEVDGELKRAIDEMECSLPKSLQ